MINIISDFLYREKMDTIIPIVIKIKGGMLILDCYEDVKNIVEEFLEKFSKDPLGRNAIDFLVSELKAYYSPSGYEPLSSEENEERYVFVCTKKTKLNYSCILSQSRMIDDEDDDSLLEYGLDPRMDEDDDYPYMATVIVENGKVVSACSENSHILSCDETELGVETLPEYRNKGYGCSNLVLLADKLLANGKSKIIYECDSSNIPSVNCAKKAGLDREGTNYYMICHKM